MKFSAFRKIVILIFVLCIFTFCKKQETNIEIPALTTETTDSITATTAWVSGYILSDGGSVIIERGICYSKNHNPLISDNKVPVVGSLGSFQCMLPGLEQNTKYYVRAYASNKSGIGYGAEIDFTTADGPGTVTDIDGNTYKTVKIGSQIWMAENLKVTHYRNGSPITEVTDSTAWVNLAKGAYCWYNNDSLSYKNKYGALYNWYSIVDSRQLCPYGWHIPTDAGSWTTLTIFLGGDSVAGTKMKSVNGWDANGNGSNESGFEGIPGGARSNNGRFLGMGEFEPWWSATEYIDSHAWLHSLYSYNGNLDRSPYNKHDGLAVRCVKN
jgi:uncharacterized protein (TIGR02145 family)